MTRFLMPEMFGLMAMASTLMIGLSMFSDLGLRQFVVQHARGGDASYLNTAWVIQIFRGVLLWLTASGISIALSVAGSFGLFPEGSVYASPSLPVILIALSFSTVVSGFTSTKLLEANRGLSLGLVTKNELVAQIVGLLCMIVWVAVDRSVWALVAGALASNAARVVLSHLWLPGVSNRWAWNEAAAREILQLGRWIFLASILGFLVNSGDQLLLAGFVDSSTLGLYVIASLYVGSVDAVLAKVMSDVSFPTFSEIVRERQSDLKRNYYRFHLFIAATAYLASGILIAIGPMLINVLYDHRYQLAGPMMSIIAPVLLVVPFRLATQSFMAMGKPQLHSHILLIRLGALAVFAPIGFYSFGLHGALLGIVLSNFSYVPLIILYNVRERLFDARREILLLMLFPIGLGFGYLASMGLEYVHGAFRMH